MAEAESTGTDIRLRVKYRRITIFLLLIAILFTLWTAAIVLSVFTYQMDARWAVLTPTEWVIIDIALVAFFLLIDAAVYMRYRAKTRPLHPKPPKMKKPRKAKIEKPAAPPMIKGHEVYTVTLPMGAKGGIFSKTFVPIDDRRVLQLRYQMIPPTTLWPPKQ